MTIIWLIGAFIGAIWRTDFAPIRKFTPSGIGIGASANVRRLSAGAILALGGANSVIPVPWARGKRAAFRHGGENANPL